MKKKAGFSASRKGSNGSPPVGLSSLQESSSCSNNHYIEDLDDEIFDEDYIDVYLRKIGRTR